MPFTDLDLDPRLLAGISALGFTEPTPIQAEAIPTLLSGRDLIGQARTGSGKTAAFGLPLLQRVIDRGPGLRALVLTPTRELALQVCDALRSFAEELDSLDVLPIYGGSSYRPQLRGLAQGMPVVVGTPGRLIDHLNGGSLDLSSVELVVIDEADEMLRMGFIDDVEALLSATPEGRQVALFSATMPDRIRAVADGQLRDPVTVQVEEAPLTVDHIRQTGVLVPHRYKLEALDRVLRAEQRGATLVFVRTRRDCAEVADALAQRGLPVDALHGDLGQSARERVMHRFRSGQLEVLIATDVASRGLDVEDVTHVINFDLPDDVETYVHRIGRTGRAGRDGRAISFVTPRERRRMSGFERELGVRIEPETVATDADIARRGRQALAEDLAAGAREEGLEEALSWLYDTAEEVGLSFDQLAAAALALLAEERGVDFETHSEEAPAWAQAPAPAPTPPPRRAEQRGQRSGPPARDEFVELFLPTGKRYRVRPGDIVGALGHGAGVPGAAIGRITIEDRKTFVGVRRDIAEALLAREATLQVRGVHLKLSRARPQ
ncbi:MAG: DEAD/DEAH box helicase [Alphaproteobacteria bacterium]|nr:DEAD/DEAH box helicase [Alphaproteobacteria bacterium]